MWREASAIDRVCVTPSQSTQRLLKLFALLPEEPGHSLSVPSSGFATIAYIAEAPKHIAEVPKIEPESPPPVSEAVLRVRLAKLGYTEVRNLVRNGDYWDATVIRNGATHLIRFHSQTGMKLEQPEVKPLLIPK